MNKKLFLRNLYFGFLSWLIPFAISFFCYNSKGELQMPYSHFKTLMIVSGVLSGCILLVLYFKKLNNDYFLQSIMVGLTWFIINILFDAIILIPMMKVNFGEYFLSIGLGYISIPIISISIGYLMQRKY